MTNTNIIDKWAYYFDSYSDKHPKILSLYLLIIYIPDIIILISFMHINNKLGLFSSLFFTLISYFFFLRCIQIGGDVIAPFFHYIVSTLSVCSLSASIVQISGSIWYDGFTLITYLVEDIYILIKFGTRRGKNMDIKQEIDQLKKVSKNSLDNEVDDLASQLNDMNNSNKLNKNSLKSFKALINSNDTIKSHVESIVTKISMKILGLK